MTILEQVTAAYERAKARWGENDKLTRALKDIIDILRGGK